MTEEIDVVVTGSRHYTDRDKVFRTLDDIHKRTPIRSCNEGGCPTGADKFAREWRESRGVAGRTFHADWAAHGKAAGPIRNGIMLRAVNPHIVPAFPLEGGSGTQDCMRQARAMGIDVLEVTE